MRNMTVGELENILKKIDNKELPVLLPLYDDTRLNARNPINHLHARFAGIIYNEEGDKAFTFGTSNSDKVTYADTLVRTDSRLDRQLYPKDVKQLITLYDYIEAGFSTHAPNGFNIYDYDIEDELDNVLLSDVTIFSNTLVYGDCVVKSISSDPYDASIPAVYISTRKLRINAGITPERYLEIIRAEKEASEKDAFTVEFVDLFHINAYVPEEDNTENK